VSILEDRPVLPLPSGPTTCERDRRWALLRELLAGASLDALIAFPQWLGDDALYLAGEPGIVVFPVNAGPSILLTGEGSDRAVRRPGWITDRASATPTGSARVPHGAALAAWFTERGGCPARVALTGLRGADYLHVRQPEGYLSYATVRELQLAFPGTAFSDGTPLLAAARLRKSAEEVRLLEHSVAVAERSIDAIEAALRTGRTQAQIYAAAVASQLVDGAQPASLAWCPGTWGQPRLRFTSSPPGDVEPGLHLSIEAMPAVRGFQAQAAAPLVVGKAGQQAAEMFELGKAAFEAGLSAIRPGVSWAAAEEQVRQVAAGTPYDIDFLVHGRGMGHDGPLLVPVDSHERVAADLIEAGTTYLWKPGVYPREQGAVVGRSHDVSCGDTIHVRPDATVRLGRRELKLTSAGTE
jgi:Xaa-Pro dipeptidase